MSEWFSDGSTVQTVHDGSYGRGPVDRLRDWFARFVCVTDDADLDLLALWTAHTYVSTETYSTPRLVLDSTLPGSGKTTVLEHLSHLASDPVQAASLSSPALLARMLSKGPRTILIDEVDRSLDPKKPGVEDLIAILNSGYKRGATRPVLVPKGQSWEVEEMPTFGPVAMAGNSPNLPDDTRSRCIRVLLMPDLNGEAESSDWEEIEIDARDLAESIAALMDELRDDIRRLRPALPERCIGRMKEKWHPLSRVAAAVGGKWPITVWELIERDIAEADMEREEGLMKQPPAMVLLRDLYAEWGEDEAFLTSSELISRLLRRNPDWWGVSSSYGRALTAQRMGRMIVQATKIKSSKNYADQRGYAREAFVTAWRQLAISPRSDQPSATVGSVEPSELIGAAS